MRNASSCPGFNHKYSKTQNKGASGKTAGCYLPHPAERMSGCITNSSKNGSSKGTVLMLPGQTEGPGLVR